MYLIHIFLKETFQITIKWHDERLYGWGTFTIRYK